MQQPPIQGAGGSAHDLGAESQSFGARTEPSSASQEPSSQRGSGVAQELRSDAQQIGSTAKDRIHSAVDSRKGDAAGQARSTANAIHRAAGELDEGTPAWLRSAFERGADQIQRFAQTLEQKDSRQLIGEVQSFARERPALFLGACAAAGFAVARVLKAGGEQEHQSFDQSQPWGDGERDFGRGDAFGQQLDEELPRAESGPFVAGPKAQSPLSSSNRTEDDPLTLGTGGESGVRIPSEGDYR